MAVNYTDTGIDPILKEHYTKKERLDVTFNRRNIAMAMITRLDKPDEGGGGREFVQPIDIAKPGGVSSSFSAAQTAYRASKYAAFKLTRQPRYIVPAIDNQSIKATKGGADSFRPLIKEIDRAMRSFGDDQEFRFFRDSSGIIGQLAVTTTLTGAVAILTDKADIHAFSQGQVVQLVALRTGGAVRTGTLTVAGIDRDLAQVTFTVNINSGVSAVAAGDFIVNNGDYGQAQLGLGDWLPTDRTILGTPFMGVTRSVDAQLLAGNVVDATGGMPLNEALINAVAAVDNMGGMATDVFVNTLTHAALMVLLEGKVQIQKIEKKISPRIGFSGFSVTVGDQDVNLWKTRSCPTSRMFVLDMDTWFLHSAGPAPDFLLEEAGYNSIVYPAPTSDAFESRIGAYQNNGCSFPGGNCVVKLAA